MARYQEFGKHLRALRESRGIKSAAALSKAASLSTNYVSILERGEVRPRWETASRLADALQLAGADREQFFQVVDAAGKPSTVRAATKAPPIPGLVLWKHLPAALYRVPHDYSGFAAINPDRVLLEVLPAAGACLAWSQVLRNALTQKQRRTLVDELTRAIDAPQPALWPAPVAEALRTPSSIASAIAPHVWHSILFGREGPTLSCVSRLQHWRYSTGLTPADPATISLTFKRPAANRACSVDSVESELVARVHDAMTLDRLWADAKLLDVLKGEPDFDHYTAPTLHVLATNLLKCDPADVHALLAATDWNSSADALVYAAHLSSYIRLVRISAFVQRVRLGPAVAAWLFGIGWPSVLEELQDRAQKLEQVLRESGARSADQPTKSAHRSRGKRSPDRP